MSRTSRFEDTLSKSFPHLFLVFWRLGDKKREREKSEARIPQRHSLRRWPGILAGAFVYFC